MLKKAQVSIEYILIALGVVVMLSIITLSVINIYSKNTVLMDNASLKSTSDKLQESFNTCELQPNFKRTITFNTYSDWKIKNNGVHSIILSNKNKQYISKTKDSILLITKHLIRNTKYDLIINKSSNRITISIEENK